MQLLVLILNNDELLDDLLTEFLNSDIKGATIIDSMGMARALTSSGSGDIPIFGSLKLMLNEGRPFNKTIFVALEDKQVDTCLGCIRRIVGELDKPDAGILFTLPINYIEGLSR